MMRPRDLGLSVLALLIWGCAASRTPGEGGPIGDCNYCVISEAAMRGYSEEAATILGRSFIVVRENDPRLSRRVVRDKACIVSIRWRRGFFSNSAAVDVNTLDDGALILRSEARGGALWAGVDGAVADALRDIAAARGAGPPLRPDVE